MRDPSGAAITRPALRWYGGKWRLASWILGYFPAHAAYTEAFGGAGSVLLRKPTVAVETWNDLHGRLVNFFRVLREQPADLIAAIHRTPYARQEYEQARQVADDPLEDARRFYIPAWQGRTGAAGNHTGRTAGWRYLIDPIARRGRPVTGEFYDTDHLAQIALRFRHVQIEHDDACAVIRRYDAPGTLHYVDPPYTALSLDNGHRYAHELTDADHEHLAEVLHQAVGMVVLSGCPSVLYDRLYAGWQRADRAALTDSGRTATECLWLNPAASAAAPMATTATTSPQLSLLAAVEQPAPSTASRLEVTA